MVRSRSSSRSCSGARPCPLSLFRDSNLRPAFRCCSIASRGRSMSEQENRLIRCFASVFPWLTPEEIRAISAESAESWDSLSAVTLTAVVQEEFALDIDPEILPNLDSFDAFRKYLRQLN